MSPINSFLLELIESEIDGCHQEEYQKAIPIDQYNFETKRTLDKLVEKYGGIVKRYQDQVIVHIRINKRKQEVKNKNDEHVNNFDEINSVIDRLAKIEMKMNDLMDSQIVTTETNNRFESYMSYFKRSKEGQTLKTLVEEILNHH